MVTVRVDVAEAEDTHHCLLFQFFGALPFSCPLPNAILTLCPAVGSGMGSSSGGSGNVFAAMVIASQGVNELLWACGACLPLVMIIDS